MTKKDDALKLALDYVLTHSIDPGVVFAAIKDALAQPEQEPVAWMDGPHLVIRADWSSRMRWKGPWVDLGRAIPNAWEPVLYTITSPH